MVANPPDETPRSDPSEGGCVRAPTGAAGGAKYDAGKVPLDLVDARAVMELARVLDFGAQKYTRIVDGVLVSGRNNWRKGLEYSRLIGAIERHTSAIKMREDVDPETGLLHAAHLMCEVMFLLHFQIKGRTELDDRPVDP